jgi:hypothetical protein
MFRINLSARFRRTAISDNTQIRSNSLFPSSPRRSVEDTCRTTTTKRPSGGYRGGIRMAHKHAHNRPLVDDNADDEDQLTISYSNSDEEETPSRPLYEPKNPASFYSKVLVSSDFESAIRNRRPVRRSTRAI